MIVRRGPDRTKDVSDFGPCPGGVDGLAAPETMALRAEVFVSPVTRRYLSAEELAVIRQAEPEDPRPVAVMVIPTRTKEMVRESGRRGAAATKRVHVVRRSASESLAIARQTAWLGRSGRTKVTEPQLLAALRETNGNQAQAAHLVGLNPPSLRERVRTLRRHDALPSDVAGMLRPRGGWRAA